MILNPLDGGISKITVKGPGGSNVSATGGGETVTGSIPSGSTQTVLTVHTVSQYSIVCDYGGNQKSGTVNVNAYWITKEIAFSYAVIIVHTHPSAAVTATKSGYSLTGTADSSGNCTLNVPAAAVNSTAWSVTANNGSASESKSATTNSYTAAPEVYPLWYVPIIMILWSGGSATYKGAEINNNYARIAPVGTTGWKAWLKASCTVRFTFLKTKVDICAIGKGGSGGNASHPDNVTDEGGGGGEGGSVDTKSSQTLSVNTDYSVSIGDTSTFGSIASASKGANASGRTGGGTSGTFRSGGNGAISVVTWQGTSHGYPGSGGGGTYAFGDSGFDGVVYSHGGQGGGVGYDGLGPGSNTGVYANPGAGGGGGSMDPSSGPRSGQLGTVLMRNAA